MTLPSDLVTNQSKQVIVDYQLDHGRPVQGKSMHNFSDYVLLNILVEWSQPYSTEEYNLILSRLYSPV